MTDFVHDDPDGPAIIGELGDFGDVGSDPDAEGGYGVPAGVDSNWVDPDADANTDLMRPDFDPLPDAQVPGAGPDGSAPTEPQV
jgi:hypothetical protein